MTAIDGSAGGSTIGGMLLEIGASPFHATLRTAGFEPRVLAGKSGAVLVTVRGARVLGIYLQEIEGNLLWVNPDAVRSASAAEKFVRDGGWNIGGDRCWLSPEIELHFLDAERPSFELYGVVPSIDPGTYAVEREAAAGLALHNAGRAMNTLTHGTFTFLMRRDIRLCKPPINPEGLSFVGYEISSYFELQTLDHLSSRYGLWHLMQLPAGGTVYIPCWSEPEPVDYFQTGVKGYCRWAGGAVRFPVTGKEMQKLGLAARFVRGRMGYWRKDGRGNASLIVRQAAVFPGALYADYPAHDRTRHDVVFQFYNDAGKFGEFGEMEYHAPAAGPPGMEHSRDVSRTWCYGGPEERVRQVAETLLGTAVED